MAINYEREKADYIRLDISSAGAIVSKHTAKGGLQTLYSYDYFGKDGARSASGDLVMKTDTAIVEARLEEAPLLRIDHIAIEELRNAKAAEAEFDQPQS
jgi:hypothetical protein